MYSGSRLYHHHSYIQQLQQKEELPTEQKTKGLERERERERERDRDKERLRDK
jgi:hypothetical protein